MRRVGFLLVAAMSLAAAGEAAADINIAIAGPMTGQYATFGVQMDAGARQAVADINAAGGLLGQKLHVDVEDDACDPRQAVAVANKMAARDIVFMAGHFCSGSSIPASSVYADADIIMISPATGNPRFSDQRPGEGVFRLYQRDDRQGLVTGAFLAERFRDRKIAIVDDKSAYGHGFAVETGKVMRANGKTEALVESYNAGEKDYNALVSKLKGAGIDVVFIGGYHTEIALIKRQMADQGMKTILVSGDALATDEYWQITGPAGAGTLMSFVPDPRKNPAAAATVAALEKAGRTAEGYALYTYAAIQAWAEAAKRAGTTDFGPVVAELATGTFATVLGEISFDEKGDARLPAYVMYEWRDGKYVEY